MDDTTIPTTPVEEVITPTEEMIAAPAVEVPAEAPVEGTVTEEVAPVATI